MQSFAMSPRGRFDLATTREYFGPWDTAGDALLAAFPVEGCAGSAAIQLSQRRDGTLHGEVHGDPAIAEAAWEQLLASLSLDVDGTGFAEVGERDPVIGRLQQRSGWLRPVCFYSPYEAAAGLILGQRSSIAQQRRTRGAMAEQHGQTFSVAGVQLAAFPQPASLLEITAFKGVPAEKLSRLHAAAEAATAGTLNRGHLRAIAYEQALAEVRTIRGVGEWTAQGIVLRGAGLTDEISDDPVSKRAVQLAYDLPALPDHEGVLEIAEQWRPYRMWALVLLHVWLRRELSDRIPRRR